jgi:hypothetical protein
MRDALRKLGGLWCRLSTLGWASPVRLFSLCVKKKKQLQERRRKRRETRGATKRADGAITPIGMSLIYSHISSLPVGAPLP